MRCGVDDLITRMGFESLARLTARRYKLARLFDQAQVDAVRDVRWSDLA